MKELMNKLIFAIFLALILFISISSDVIIQIPPYSNRSVQANLNSQLFNFTINNSEEIPIIQVNISLPSGFNYVLNSAGTNALFESFGFYENTLSWSNSSGLIGVFSSRSFWFNSSVPNVGVYNFTVSLLYSNGTVEIKNETVYVRRVFVELNLDKYIVNPNENITVFGKAILLPDNLNVSNNTINIWLNERLVGRYYPMHSGWNWLSGFGYKIPITITERSGNNLQDYQVLITVNTSALISAGKMRNDCGDIRFTDSDGITLLPYWIESGCNTTNTRIWVRVNLTANQNKTIYLYYGNSLATSIQDFSLITPSYIGREFYSTCLAVSDASFRITSYEDNNIITIYRADNWQLQTTLNLNKNQSTSYVCNSNNPFYINSTKLISVIFDTLSPSSASDDDMTSIYGKNIWIRVPRHLGICSYDNNNQIRISNTTWSTQITLNEGQCNWFNLGTSFYYIEASYDSTIQFGLDDDNIYTIIYGRTFPNGTQIYNFYSHGYIIVSALYSNTSIIIDNLEGTTGDWSGVLTNEGDYIRTQQITSFTGSAPEYVRTRVIANKPVIVYTDANGVDFGIEQIPSINGKGSGTYFVFRVGWSSSSSSPRYIRIIGTEPNTVFNISGAITQTNVNIGRGQQVEYSVTTSWGLIRINSNNPIIVFERGYNIGEDITVILPYRITSPEPSFSIGSEELVTSTDSFGNYNYTFRAPLEAGTYVLKVNLTNPNGIYGENQTLFVVNRIEITNISAISVRTRINNYLDVDDELINISALVYRNLDNPINYVWANITIPNGSSYIYYLENTTLRNNTQVWFRVINITREFDRMLGNYTVRFYANSTLSNGTEITQRIPEPITWFIVQNISVSIDLDKYISNPNENITVFGKAILLPDNLNLSNNTINIWLNEKLIIGGLFGFNYRIPITITERSGNNLQDYQVLITVNTSALISAGKMRSDCRDIRFTDSDGTTLLPYWIEPNTCNTANTRIWIRVPNIPANQNKTIYMYYGNSSATSMSDISNVFIWMSREIFPNVANSTWGSGSSNPEDTFNTYCHDARNEILIRATDFQGFAPVNTTQIIIYVNQQPGRDLENYRVRYQLTERTSLTNTFTTTGWILVFGPTNLGRPAAGTVVGLNLNPNILWTNHSLNLLLDLSRDMTAWASGGGMFRKLVGIPNTMCTYYSDSGRSWPFDGSCDLRNYIPSLIFLGWFKTYSSIEPSFSIGSEELVTSTDSFGNYNYTFRAPLEAGTYVLKVNLTNPNGIYGENQTILKVRYGEINLTKEYSIYPNFTEDLHCSVYYIKIGEYVNSTNNSPVYGNFSIKIDNFYQEITSLSNYTFRIKVGVHPSCDILPENETIFIKVENETAFYWPYEDSLNYFFESLTTTGRIIAYNITVYNISQIEDTITYLNVSITNTGNGTMRNLNVTLYLTSKGIPDTAFSEFTNVYNITPMPDLKPNETINITFAVIIPAGTKPGDYCMRWQAIWINNNQSVNPRITTRPCENIIRVVGNPIITLSTKNITQEIWHGNNYLIKITLNNTGNAPLNNVWINYTEINLSKEWITILPNYFEKIDENTFVEFFVNISIPLGTDPSIYIGKINITSNLGREDERIEIMDVNITVPLDSRWYIIVYSREGKVIEYINETYGLNEAGYLGNITIVNLGNIPLNFLINYEKILNDPFDDGDRVFSIPKNGCNPNSIFVNKISNVSICLYQNGFSNSRSYGLNITFTNYSALPNINYTLVYWHIVDLPPLISNLTYSPRVEIKKLQNITAHYYDDENKLALIYINITLPNNTIENIVCHQGNLHNKYYSCSYYPQIEGLYRVNLTTCDLGNKCRTINFTFIAMAKTSLQVFPITTYINVENITKINSRIISLNISITNLNDTVTAYNITLTSLSPGGTNWIVNATNISQILPNLTIYTLLNITIPERTAPQEYTIRPYVTWNNPDGTSNTVYSLQTITMNVLPTRILNLTYYPTALTVNHNSSVLENFTIYSLGNAEVRNISFICSRAATLCNYISFIPDFIQNLNAGEIRNITLLINLPLGFSDGFYYPKINITSIDDYKSFELEITVPKDYRYITDKDEILLKLLAGRNYTKNILNITNVGNQILTFLISLEGNITEIMNLIENNKQLNPTEKFAIFVNISAPNYLSVYEGNLTINETSLGTRKVPIRIEVYPAELIVNYPNSQNPIINVLENQTIEINLTFRIGEKIIISNTSFSILIDNQMCKINEIKVLENSWIINCSLPKLEDGRWHNLTIIAYYEDLDIVVQKTEINALYYKDITKPRLISKKVESTEYPKNVTIELNLTDNVAIDKVLMFIEQLNQFFELQTENNFTYRIELANLQSNDYDITFIINDTTNNTLIFKDYFEVYILKYVWVNITNSKEEPVNLNFTFYRNNTNQILKREEIVGYKNFSLSLRLYDVLIESKEAKIKLFNLSTYELQNDFIKYDKVHPTEINLYKPLGGFAVITSIKLNSTIRVYYDVSIAQQYGAIEDNLKIIYCSEWDFYEKRCLNWIQLPSTVNKRFKFVETNAVFQEGAYVVAEGIRKEAKLDVYDPLPIDVHHNQKYSITFTIQSSGTDPVSNIRIECLYGSVCYDFNPEYIPFVGTLMPVESREIRINITIPNGYPAGNYVGTLRITSAEGIERITYLRVNVLNNYSFLVNDYFEVSIGKGFGLLTNLTIRSIANNDILLRINTSQNISSINEFLLRKLEVKEIPVYYNLNREGNYIEKIILYNKTLNISKEITFNITVVNFTLILVQLTQQIEIYPNQTLNILLRALFENEEINQNISFRILLNEKECLIRNVSYSNNAFNISCMVPITKVYNDLIIEAFYRGFKSSLIIPNLVKVIDTIKPQIKINVIDFEVNKENSIVFEVNDNDIISNILISLILPNQTEIILPYSKISENLYESKVFIEEKGDYLIKVFAIDNSSNYNIEQKLVRAGEKIRITVKALDITNRIVKMFIELLNPIEKQTEYNLKPDESATINQTVFAGTYDLKVIVEKSEILYKNVKLNTSIDDIVKIDVFSVHLANVTKLRNRLFALAIKEKFDFENYTLYFDISDYQHLIRNVNNLRIYKCKDWILEDRVCNSTWIEIKPLIDLKNNRIYFEFNSSSAYLFAEAVICGDNICDESFGESCNNCPQDCGNCPTAPTYTPSPQYIPPYTPPTPSIDYSKIQEMLKELAERIELKTEEIYFELKPGESDIKKIYVSNNKNKNVYAEIELYGDAAKFLSVNNRRILINKKSTNYFEIFAKIPKDETAGIYKGHARIISENESFIVPITVKVLQPELKLLDLKLNLLSDKVKPGDYLRAEVTIYNLGKEKRVDINLTLSLIDSENMIEIVRNEESLAVETSLTRVMSLKIPKNIVEKRYLVRAVATYLTENIKQEAVASAFVTIETPLLEKEFFGLPLKTILLYFAIFSSGSLITSIAIISYIKKKEKEKRFKVTIDFSTLPQATENSIFIGNIAETAKRAFLYLDDLKMHSMVAGATGSGKTISAMVIAEEALLKGRNVIVFDPTAQWTGFLRKCKEKYMLKEYSKFGMSTKQAKGFPGKIKIIRNPYQKIKLKEIIENPKGNIYIFVINRLKPEEIDVFVANTIQEIFNSQLEESKELKCLIVYDEVHRLLPKFGGSGKGFLALERGVREFRKWGIGLVLISQVLSDFIGEIRANIGTEIQLRTRYEGDLERIKMKYGEEFVTQIVKANVGTGMIVNSEYNRGRPYFVSFRPILHQVTRLSDKELDEYDKRDRKIEELKFYIEILKQNDVDTFDLETELNLAESKLMQGAFDIVDIYLESLEPRIKKEFEKRKIKMPKYEEILVGKESIEEIVEEAKEEREKIIKKERKGYEEILNEIKDIEELIKKLRDGGKDTFDLEIELEKIKSKVKIYEKTKEENILKEIEEKINEIKPKK